MKWIAILYTALFPFLHDTTYKAELVSCEKDKIVINAEGSDMLVSLFNMKIMNDEGWNQTCSLLQEADTISFEIDNSSKVEEPLPVYLFADDKLIQEEMIVTQQGYSIIQNPEYRYQSRLQEIENSMQTMAEPSAEKSGSSRISFGFLYLISFMLGWLYLYYYLFRKNNKRTKPSPVNHDKIES